MVHPPVSKELIDVDQILRVDRDHLIHPLYHPADHVRPLVIVRGEGAEIFDANGKGYFDALSGLWNVHVGHGRAVGAADDVRVPFGRDAGVIRARGGK